MKKLKLNTAKLQLKKEKIVDLTNNYSQFLNGGGMNNKGQVGFATSGCSDGRLCHSKWNCTRADCSNDCPLHASKLICPTPETSVQSKYC